MGAVRAFWDGHAMRRMLKENTRVVVIAVIAAVIASAATATAAKLITGEQIKDGTITAKDLSKAVRAQLKKSGTPGPKGAAGAAGTVGAGGAAGGAGPAGTAKAWAHVDFDGTLIDGENVESARLDSSPGLYCLKATGFTPKAAVATIENNRENLYLAFVGLGGLGNCDSILPGTNSFVAVTLMGAGSSDARFFVFLN